MTFRALVIDKAADGTISQTVRELDDGQLPEGDVTIRIDYSTLNYKDGLCMHGQGGLVRNYPHVPGVDFSGVVEASDDQRYQPGDRVVLTGWRVGEVRWGGYATRARAKADWLVKLPDSISNRQAMAIGTAGLTSMFADMALEKAGLTPDKGEVLVTGAAGGVGSVAVAILARLGYAVAAVTGRPEMADYLRGLGAAAIIDRSELAEAGKDEHEGKEDAGEKQKGIVHGRDSVRISLEPSTIFLLFTIAGKECTFRALLLNDAPLEMWRNFDSSSLPARPVEPMFPATYSATR